MKNRNIPQHNRNSPGAARGANREIALAHTRCKTGMFHFTKWGLIILIYFASQKILADTHYVSPTGGNISPYTSWANAATNIQPAVNVAVAGETVLVTNGIYYPGSQISVAKAITVKSVNGSGVTIVNGSHAHRCFNLTSANPIIDGFTITNGYITGASATGGGIYCNQGGTVMNCVIVGNVSQWSGGGIGCYQGGTIQSCVINGNTAQSQDGGGLYVNQGGTVQNCTIVNNFANRNGGGIEGNSGGEIQNCIIYDNTGGEIHGSPSENRYNCIKNWSSHSNGNISDDPQFVSAGDYHLLPTSPCLNVGTNLPYVLSSTDIEGNPRLVGNKVDMGAYEYSALLGLFYADKTNGFGSLSCDFTGWAYGTNTVNVNYYWDFENDGTFDNFGPDRTNLTHFYSSVGTYSVLLKASNAVSEVSEILKTDYINVLPVPPSPIHYVSLSGGNVWPYHTWEFAATNIQDAVYAAIDGDTVLVTNGTYYLTWEIQVTNNVIVESVNGPAHTIVDGNNVHRSFFLNNYSPTISGFTITNGNPPGSQAWGGGIYCYNGGTITNCIVINNHAYNAAGIYCRYGTSTVVNCSISGNTAGYSGGGIICNDNTVIQNCTINNNEAVLAQAGGIHGGQVKNCTVDSNTANSGGGIYYGRVVENCTIKGNSAATAGGGIYCGSGNIIQNCLIINNTEDSGSGGGGIHCYDGGTIQNCTISGNSSSGVKTTGGIIQNSIIYGNTGEELIIFFATNRYNCIKDWPNLVDGIITNNPEFVSASDFHLLNFSDCIDGGTNLPYVYTTTDLDGNPRLYGPTVDMGCYEYIPEPGAFGAVISYLLLVLGICRKLIPIAQVIDPGLIECRDASR